MTKLAILHKTQQHCYENCKHYLYTIKNRYIRWQTSMSAYFAIFIFEHNVQNSSISVVTDKSFYQKYVGQEEHKIDPLLLHYQKRINSPSVLNTLMQWPSDSLIYTISQLLIAMQKPLPNFSCVCFQLLTTTLPYECCEDQLHKKIPWTYSNSKIIRRKVLATSIPSSAKAAVKGQM